MLTKIDTSSVIIYPKILKCLLYWKLFLNFKRAKDKKFMLCLNIYKCIILCTIYDVITQKFSNNFTSI